MKKFALSTWFYFLVPSILGILLFMIPMKYERGLENANCHICRFIVRCDCAGYAMGRNNYSNYRSTWFSCIFGYRKDKAKPSFITNLFKVSLFWTIVRIIGAILAVLTMLQVGPEAIWNENTGGLLLSETGLVTFLFTIFLFAGILLPLLLNFGLLEFFGTMMVK